MGNVGHDNDIIMITVIVIITNNKFVRVRMDVESQTRRRRWPGAYFFQKNTIIIIFQNIKNALIIENNVIIDTI